MSTISIIITIAVILALALMILFLIGACRQNKAYDKKVDVELKLYRVGNVYATVYDRDQAMRLISTHYARIMGDDYTEKFVNWLGIYDKHREFEVIPKMCREDVYNHFLALKENNEAIVFIA